VWRFEDATGWQQLTPNDCSQVSIDAQGDVAAELPGYGVWRFEDATAWQQLSPADATFVSIANGEVLADFQGAGVQLYIDGFGFTSLTGRMDATSISLAGS
jgi:hypothetical protein